MDHKAIFSHFNQGLSCSPVTLLKSMKLQLNFCLNDTVKGIFPSVKKNSITDLFLFKKKNKKTSGVVFIELGYSHCVSTSFHQQSHCPSRKY